MPRIASSWTAVAILLAASVASAQSPPENVILRGHLDRGENYSGNWGYTSPTGIELAISGTASGTTFINATDPSNPVEVAFIPAPNSVWREMATYGQYCYIVTEASGAALQVVSLANPLAPVLVATLNPPAFHYSTAHEIKIDQQTGYCYVAGTGPGTGQPNRGLVILDLNANPTNPPLRGTWTTVYVHDLSLLNGRAYCATLDNGVYVLDVTQPGTPPVLGHWTYPGEFTHNTWPSADAHYLVTSDETGGGHLRMWDISNLSQVVQTGEYAPTTNSIVHNVYLRGNLCYMSHYRDGLRVVDVSNPFNLQSVGWYDTHAASGSGFDGAWGCWCFAADPTIAYISDIQTGTYILQFNNNFGTLQGTVRNSTNQSPVGGAAVEVVGAANRTTNAQGFYSAILDPGSYTVNCSAFGFEPASSGANITAAQTTVLDFSLVPSPSGSLTGIVRRSTDSTVIPGVSMILVSTPLGTTTGAGGDYNFPSVPAGGYSLSASKLGYAPRTLPVNIVASQQTTQNVSLVPAYYSTDMETSPGWTISGNAATGQWVLVDPNGTVGGTVQTEDDHTPAPGVMCWVTGQGSVNGGVGDNDVDGGSTILTTQIFDLSSLTDPRLNYWRWYSNDYNGSADDPWVVEVSSNGGTNWTAIENSLAAEAFWKPINVRIADYVTPGAQFRVRFTARDLAPASIVEAAVDDFQIYEGQAPTGVDQPSAVVPVRPALLGNSPNPFHPATAIRFDLPQAGPVSLRVYDVAGRLVRVLFDGRLPAGQQSVVWDGRDESARPLAGGVYFYRVEAGSLSDSRSMVLAK